MTFPIDGTEPEIFNKKNLIWEFGDFFSIPEIIRNNLKNLLFLNLNYFLFLKREEERFKLGPRKEVRMNNLMTIATKNKILRIF